LKKKKKGQWACGAATEQNLPERHGSEKIPGCGREANVIDKRTKTREIQSGGKGGVGTEKTRKEKEQGWEGEKTPW